MKWRPIETCPIDQLVYLAHGDKVCIGQQWFHPFEEHRDAEGRFIDQTDADGGFMAIQGPGDENGNDIEPHAWAEIEMPLPPPPAE
jgi:hypothetical protein